MQALEALRRVLQAGTQGYVEGYAPTKRRNELAALEQLWKEKQYTQEQDRMQETTNWHNVMEKRWQDELQAKNAQPPEQPKTLEAILADAVNKGTISLGEAVAIKKGPQKTATSKTPSYSSAASEADKRLKGMTGQAVSGYASQKYPNVGIGEKIPDQASIIASMLREQPMDTTVVDNPGWFTGDSTIVKPNPLYDFMKAYQYSQQPQTRDSVIRSVLQGMIPKTTSDIPDVTRMSDEELERLLNGE